MWTPFLPNPPSSFRSFSLPSLSLPILLLKMKSLELNLCMWRGFAWTMATRKDKYHFSLFWEEGHTGQMCKNSCTWMVVCFSSVQHIWTANDQNLFICSSHVAMWAVWATQQGPASKPGVHDDKRSMQKERKQMFVFISKMPFQLWARQRERFKKH